MNRKVNWMGLVWAGFEERLRISPTLLTIVGGVFCFPEMAARTEIKNDVSVNENK
jgi:hypothetical protein